MAMKHERFCAFILTHGRANRVYTYKTLKKSGYTGPIVIVVDNEDRTIDEYKKVFKDQVYVFDKKAMAAKIDEGDNFQDRRAIIYARNACFEIAEAFGYEYFIQLDDDYTDFRHKKKPPRGILRQKNPRLRRRNGRHAGLLQVDSCVDDCDGPGRGLCWRENGQLVEKTKA